MMTGPRRRPNCALSSAIMMIFFYNQSNRYICMTQCAVRKMLCIWDITCTEWAFRIAEYWVDFHEGKSDQRLSSGQWIRWRWNALLGREFNLMLGKGVLILFQFSSSLILCMSGLRQFIQGRKVNYTWHPFRHFLFSFRALSVGLACVKNT
jgi:hypothetical protein